MITRATARDHLSKRIARTVEDGSNAIVAPRNGGRTNSHGGKTIDGTCTFYKRCHMAKPYTKRKKTMHFSKCTCASRKTVRSAESATDSTARYVGAINTGSVPPSSNICIMVINAMDVKFVAAWAESNRKIRISFDSGSDVHACREKLLGPLFLSEIVIHGRRSNECTLSEPLRVRLVALIPSTLCVFATPDTENIYGEFVIEEDLSVVVLGMVCAGRAGKGTGTCGSPSKNALVEWRSKSDVG